YVTVHYQAVERQAFRVEHARHDQSDIDTFGRDLEAQAVAGGAQTPFRRAVDADAGYRRERAHRSDKNGAAAALGRKVRRGVGDGRERRDEVKVDQLAPKLRGTGRDRAGHAFARDRDDAVETAELTRGFVDRGGETVEIGHVGRHRDRRVA